MTERISKTITVSRFPLIFLIVLLHTIVLGQSYPHGIEIPVGKYALLDVVQFVSQREIGDLAVPAFFLVSGFLFFSGKKMDMEVWKGKLKKRVHSLLIPYLIWNTLFLLYYLFLSCFLDIDWGLSDYNLSQYVDLYLGFEKSPILAPLWFIRDLMVLNILSYPFFFIVRKLRWLAIPLLVVPFLFANVNAYMYPYIGIRSVVPYYLGAWFAIHEKEFVLNNKNRLIALNGLFVVLVICVSTFHFSNISCRVLQQTEIVVGMFTLFSDFHFIYKYRDLKISKSLSESSFFVFVAHMFIMNLPNKLWVLVFPVNGVSASLMQWLIPMVVSMFLCCTYYVLKQISPQMTYFLIGGRS